VRRRLRDAYSSFVVDSNHDGHMSKSGDNNLHWASQDSSDRLHWGESNGQEHPSGKGQLQGSGDGSASGKGKGYSSGKGKGGTKIHRDSASEVAGRGSELESSVDHPLAVSRSESLSNDPISQSGLDDDYYDDSYLADDIDYYENGNCWKPCKGKAVHTTARQGKGGKGSDGSRKYGSNGNVYYHKRSGTQDPAHHVKDGHGNAGSHKYGGIDNHRYHSKSGVYKPEHPLIGGNVKGRSHGYASRDSDHYHSKSNTHKRAHSSKGVEGKAAGYGANHQQYGEGGGSKEALSPRSERVKEWERTIIEDIFGERQEYSLDVGLSYHYDDDVGFGAMKASATTVGRKDEGKTGGAEKAVKTSNLHREENWSKKNSNEGRHSDDGGHYPRSIYYKL
jgi:hypothetical protein